MVIFHLEWVKITVPHLQNTPFSHLFSNLLIEFDNTATYGIDES